MKKILAIVIILFVRLSAQEFIVEKVSGNVSIMRGTEEEWKTVQWGQKLTTSDLITTGEKSYVQLSNHNGQFILQSNSALNLSNVKKLTINELLLALAAEEIRNIPAKKNNSNLKNTAVYGNESSNSKIMAPSLKELGFKKINGSKQLAESGYKESALVVAKETFRKYPETKTNIEDRLYFVDLMLNLRLKNEAAAELMEIKKLTPGNMLMKEIDSRLIKIREENQKTK